MPRSMTTIRPRFCPSVGRRCSPSADIASDAVAGARGVYLMSATVCTVFLHIPNRTPLAAVGAPAE